MLHSPWSTVLDACVLYPSLLRDLLMHLGITGLYQPKWTDSIQQEWQRNLLVQRPDIRAEQLRRTEILMNKAFRSLVLRAVRNARASLSKPPYGTDEYLACLQQAGLPLLARALQPWRLLL